MIFLLFALWFLVLGIFCLRIDENKSQTFSIKTIKIFGIVAMVFSLIAFGLYFTNYA